MQPLGIAKLDASSAPQLGQMRAERMVKKLGLPATKKVALPAGPPSARSMIIPIRCPALPDASDRLPNPFCRAFPNDESDGDPNAKGLRFDIHTCRLGSRNRYQGRQDTALVPQRFPSTPKARRLRARSLRLGLGRPGGREKSREEKNSLCRGKRLVIPSGPCSQVNALDSHAERKDWAKGPIR